ncbi:AEC family transporter [Nitratifractor sp.]
MERILWLLPFFAAGYGARFFLSERRAERASYWLNRYVVYVALPALVLIYVPRMHPDLGALIPVLSAWGIFAASALLVLAVARAAGWSRSLTGALLFTVPYGNTSFLGVPFTQAFFGEAGLPYTMIYDQMGSFLILSIVGIAQLSYYTAESFAPLKILKRILLFPAFLALLFSLAFLGHSWPGWIGGPLRFLAGSLSLVAMVAIGLQLKLRFSLGEGAPFAFAMLVKLFVAPLALLGLFWALGFQSLPAKVSVFEAAMAPMVSSSIMAMLAGLEQRFIASVLGYGILLSFLSVPVVYWLIGKVL